MIMVLEVTSLRVKVAAASCQGGKDGHATSDHKTLYPTRPARSFGKLRTGSFDWAQDKAGATPALD
jgi:hypothetical protein